MKKYKVTINKAKGLLFENRTLDMNKSFIINVESDKNLKNKLFNFIESKFGIKAKRITCESFEDFYNDTVSKRSATREALNNANNLLKELETEDDDQYIEDEIEIKDDVEDDTFDVEDFYDDGDLL